MRLIHRSRWLAALVALQIVHPAAAQQTVMLGSDYFQTEPGTSANISGIGLVGFVGNPVGPGNTDTIVQRQADADITGGSATIPIEIVALSLKSAAPVNVGGSFFDVFVTLDPAPGHNTGQMTIHGTTAGGTFDSFFDVFFDVTLTEVGNPGNTTTLAGLDLGNLSQTGAPWSPIPPPGTLLLDGPFGDQNANHHTSGVPAGEVDFFPVGVLQEVNNQGPETHNVKLTGGGNVPEPGALAMLFGGGLASSLIVFRRRSIRK